MGRKNINENIFSLTELIPRVVKAKKEVDYRRTVGELQSPDDHTLVIKSNKLWPQVINDTTSD
jgi:hypothetical protein